MKKLKNLVRIKARAYKEVFLSGGNNADIVLADIIKFCGYNKCSHTPGDPYTTEYNLGLKRYAERVMRYLNMSEQEMARIDLILKESQDHIKNVYDPFSLQSDRR